MLDRVELGRIARQVHQSGAGLIEQFPHLGGVVRAQVVQHQDRTLLHVLEFGPRHVLSLADFGAGSPFKLERYSQGAGIRGRFKPVS